MDKLDKIIEEAKKKEMFSYSKTYNYGPIEHLHNELTKEAKNFKEMMFSLAVFHDNVHRVTDAKTYFVWQFIKADLLVYCSPLYMDVKECFPEVTMEQFKQWLDETIEENQTAIW